jgi:hypothetical protein
VTVPSSSIRLSAGLVLCFSCFGQIELPMRQWLGHVQLIEGFKAPNPLLPRRKAAPPAVIISQSPQSVPVRRCGYIIVKAATPDLDPKIVNEVPEGFVSKMPVYKGLPPCPTP